MSINYSKDTRELESLIDSDDLLMRKFKKNGFDAIFYYIDGMSDKLLLEQNILRPLLESKNLEPTLEFLQATVKYSEKIIEKNTVYEAAEAIASGDIALFIEKAKCYYIFSIRKFNIRSVQEPPTETVLRGPREGFIEEIKTNLTLIRRRLRTPNLRIKQFNVGRYSATTVCITYIDGIVDPSIVKTLSEKISRIDIDGIIDTSYVERFIEENSQTFFNQSGITEKPDILAAKMLEGRVGIMVDGSPIVITVPYVMFESFQDSYDYYTRDARSTMLRIMRIFATILSVIIPGMFVAMQEFHYHLLPHKFLITILNSVSNIPFTSPMEMLFVLIIFEILNQASIRMPRYVGTAVSVVGAIVLGQTAVNAGLLSSPAVLIIAISAIGINCVPDLVDSLSILRLIFLLVGSVLGLYGLIIAQVILIGYFCSLENYGTPYLAPFGPIIPSDLKDGIIKENIINMESRPYSIPTKNHRRIRNNEK